jgi:DNA-binding FadR family transcriptional regulator
MIDAAGNVVFVLIMNTLRELYFAHAELFRAVVDGQATLVPLYARAADAIAARDGPGASAAVAELAGLQEQQLKEALR